MNCIGLLKFIPLVLFDGKIAVGNCCVDPLFPTGRQYDHLRNRIQTLLIYMHDCSITLACMCTPRDSS